MNVEGAIAIVTGGGGGIGAALVSALAGAGAAGIVVYDRDAAAAERVAKRHDAVAASGDVSSEADIRALVALTEKRFGRIDLFVSNAGVMIDGGLELPNEAWARSFGVNVLAHVCAARAAMPGMLARGSGYFLNVSSAAGMLMAPGSAPYGAAKHAALGFAEWLAATYAAKGIGVSVLCPEAVQTKMLEDSIAAGNEGVRRIMEAGVIEPSAVAAAALAAIADNRFLITTHPTTLENTQRKWSNIDRWIKGMSRFLETAFKTGA